MLPVVVRGLAGFAVLAMALPILGCPRGRQRERSSPDVVPDVAPADSPPVSPEAPSLPPQEAASPADLRILEVRVEKAESGGNSWYTHTIIGVVSNTGGSAATGFNVGCSYRCPGGLVLSGGAQIEQGAYIRANTQFSYRAGFHIYCEGPPAILNLECQVDPNGRVQESDESNNSYSVSVQIPQ